MRVEREWTTLAAASGSRRDSIATARVATIYALVRLRASERAWKGAEVGAAVGAIPGVVATVAVLTTVPVTERNGVGVVLAVLVVTAGSLVVTGGGAVGAGIGAIVGRLSTPREPVVLYRAPFGRYPDT